MDTKTNFNFASLLKENNKRRGVRIPKASVAVVYNSEGERLTKAVLKNVSRGGLGLETTADFELDMSVFIGLPDLGGEFGPLRCKIAWVTPIDGHPKNHKMIGLRFEDKTFDFLTKFRKFTQAS